jgi:hypothetical protein
LIAKNVVDPELRTWIMPDFSTTEESDSVVAAILMMGALQQYFEYRFSLCRYTCFNQRARVSLYCNTYALVDGCLILLRMQCRQHICVPRIDHVHRARETNDYQQSPLWYSVGDPLG